MHIKYRIILLIAIVVLLWRLFDFFNITKEDVEEIPVVQEPQTEHVDPVKVSVFYEALCPDSKFFVTYQLLPLYEDMQEYIEVDLVPYGKAQTMVSGDLITFQCQHEEVECFANKIHACAIDILTDPLQTVKYVACMITDNRVPEEAGEKCAQQLDIKFTPIIECAKNNKGSLLLKAFGERTHSLSPSVHFIPTIELNGSQHLVPLTDILKDLRKSVCQVFRKRPKKCGW